MAVLEKIRVKLGVFITVVIAVALLSFIIDPSTLASVTQSMSSKYDVGKINGKSVSYEDFQKDIDTFTAISEIVTGSSVQSEQQQKSIRDAAWQSLVDKYLFLQNAKAAGIVVGDVELVDLTIGDNLSPVIAQDPVFRNENGEFSKQAVIDLVSNLDADPSGNSRMYWKYLQNTVNTQQYYVKYGSLFSESDLVNPLMLSKLIEENNNTVDAEFVMVPYGYQQDSTIVVSDSEIKKYYDSHKKFYKQNASRDIEYVVFEAVPSAKDIEKVNTEVAENYDEFASTDNMKSFLLQNSDRQLSNYYYKTGELKTISEEVEKFVAENKVGAVSPVIAGENVFYVVKVMDEKKLPDQVYVHAFPIMDVAKADSLVNVINKGQSFATAAALNAISQQYVYEGWMNQSNMIDESVLTAPLNKAYSFNFQNVAYILQVTEKGEVNNKKSVAIYQRDVTPSQETRNTFYAKANEVSSKAAGEINNFAEAVKSVGGYVHPLNKMAESSDRLGAVENTKEITRWAFDAKKGQVSNVITVGNDYFFVVALKNIHKEGFAPVEEVSPMIRQQLYTEKLGEKKVAEIAQKINGLGSMEAVAEALGTTVSTKEAIAFSSLTSQGLDPKFIGAVSVAEEGKISGPVAGSYGVYVYKVTGKDTGAFFTEDDAKSRDAQMAQYNQQMLLPAMMENTVKDNRARFF